MARGDHRTLPGDVLGDRITVVQSEVAVRAKVLRLTEEFCRPPLHTTGGMTGRMWSEMPNSPEDAEGWRLCAKSGMKVPLHDQAFYENQCYSKRYVPEGPRS